MTPIAPTAPSRNKWRDGNNAAPSLVRAVGAVRRTAWRDELISSAIGHSQRAFPLSPSVTDAGFAYVNVFKAHLNVGFFRGATIADPDGLLEGTGKFMRHVKLRTGREFNAAALTTLIHTAYSDMKERVWAESPGESAYFS